MFGTMPDEEEEPPKNIGGRPKGTPDTPQLLRDMRWAYKNAGRERSGTPNQEAARGDLERDRDGFLKRLTEMEKSWEKRRKEIIAERQRRAELAASLPPIQFAGMPPPPPPDLTPPPTPAAAVPAAPPPDLGTERCLELVGRLIQDAREEADRG
jgi:hypothetical protein